jgi:hypothetical protein
MKKFDEKRATQDEENARIQHESRERKHHARMAYERERDEAEVRRRSARRRSISDDDDDDSDNEGIHSFTHSLVFTRIHSYSLIHSID